MRFYLVKGGHIILARDLEQTDDAGAHIKKAHELFDNYVKVDQADSFEVWDGTRLVFRYPPKKEEVS